MDSSPEIITQIRPYLEALSFLAVASMAICAVCALRQIGILKQTLRVQSTRDALKMTGEQCQDYMNRIIGLQDTLHKEIEDLGITYYEGWDVEVHSNGIRIKRNKEPSKDEIDATLELREHIVLNALESFSSFFTSRAADERVAFGVVGENFINTCSYLMPVILTARENGHYKNTFSLYVMWANRKKAEELERKKNNIEKELAKTKQEFFTPVGGDFT